MSLARFLRPLSALAVVFHLALPTGVHADVPPDEFPEPAADTDVDPGDDGVDGMTDDGDTDPVADPTPVPVIDLPPPVLPTDAADAVAIPIDQGALFSDEARAFLPVDVLVTLPRALTSFLRPADWVAMKAACPQAELAERLACLQTPEIDALLGDLFERAAVTSLLGRMDAELALRVPQPTVEALATACEKPATVWANCVFKPEGAGEMECTAEEDELANCLVAQDETVELYLDVQSDKKKAFGAEAFIDLRGVLGYLTLAQVAELKAACPMPMGPALVTCFSEQPSLMVTLTSFVEAADGIVTEATTEIEAAGNAFPAEAREALRERVLNLLFTLPVTTLAQLAKACETADPTLAKVTSVEDVDRSLACIDAGATRDPVANPAIITKEKLRGWLERGRDKVTTALRLKEAATQDRLSGTLVAVVGILCGLGVLAIFLMPLFLKKKYPQGGSALWKATAMAAAAFVLSMAVLGGTLLAIRTVQGRVATDSSSPKMRIADAAFEVLLKDESLEGFVAISTLHLDFIKAPLREMLRENPDASVAERAASFAAYIGEHWTSLLQEPEFKRLAKNLTTLKERGAELASLVKLFRNVDWLMGLMPIILAILAVLLYMLPLREWLVSIVTAPMRADAPASGAFGPVRQMLLGELKGVPGFLLLLLLLLPLAGIGIAIAIEPLMELFIFSLLANVLIIIGGETSGLLIYGSMIGSMLLMVLTLAVFILGTGAASGAAQRILRARFQRGIALSTHKAFYAKAALSAVWLFVFPVLFAFGLQAAGSALLDSGGEALEQWKLWAVPLFGAVAFALLFVALRAMRAFRYLKKYRPETVAA